MTAHDDHAKERAFLAEIKLGDRVWIGEHNNQRAYLKTVTKVTATTFVLDDDGEFGRYDRQWGRQKANLTFRKSIVAIATPEECAKHDTEQAKKKATSDAFEAKKKAHEAERERLNKIFDGTPAYVSGDSEKETWTLKLPNLAPSTVEFLAQFVHMLYEEKK